MSEKFSLSSYRNGQIHTIIFEEGVKVDDIKETSKKQHGTITKFIPSKKYLGKSARIPKKGLIDWVDSISYFIPKDCKIELEIWKGLERLENYKFKARPITELLKSKISDEVQSSVVNLKVSQKMEEDVLNTEGKSKKVKRDLELELAFVYTNSIEPYVDSFCNYINTVSGGVHLDATKEAIWRYFMKKTNEIMSDNEREKYKVLKVDIEQGLNLIVNLSTDMQMQLVGQTKNAVGNTELHEPIKALVSDGLDKFFSTNKDKLTQITKLIKAACKARLEASKIKAATISGTVNKFDKHKIKKFTPCNNDGKAYKELHLCEGDSAAGSLVDGRDPDTQAVFGLRGVVANGFKRDGSTILDNDEWRTYVTLLKTNIGPKFDLSKCYYDKIIIETDSDVDGHGITSGIGAFHALYLPEIVKAGKLYKVMAPLYHIDDKDTPYVRDRREYAETYQHKIIGNYDIKLVSIDSSKKLPEDEFKEFIYETQEYSDTLIRLAKHFSVNKFLIERIAAFILMHYDEPDVETLFNDSAFVVKFLEVVQKKFPEMVLSGKYSLRGAIDGRFQSITINNLLIRKVRELKDIYDKYGYSLLVREKKSDYREMSIGEFWDNASKFKSRIIMRYKGLGELDSKELWNTTLNPDTRALIQLTMDDVNRDLAKFEKLFGQTKKNLFDRKEMMSNYKIKREDLDN